MTETKIIAALLTVHNRKDKTLACLEQLYAQTLPEGYTLDVFLTDDGCTDGTPEAVTRQYPEVKIIKGDGSLFWNRGMIAAWNAALQTDPNHYLLLNDDTFLLPEALSSLIKTSIQNSDNAIVVGSCHATDDENRLTYGGRDEKFRLIDPTTENTAKAITFNANIVLVPRSVFKQLGTLDPIFHHSLGDFDYGLRATKHGIAITLAPGYAGACDTHPNIDKWADPSKPLRERWKHFMSPTGANPFEFFKFKRRHKGIVAACFTFCSNFVHVLFPSLWSKKLQS